MNRIIWTCWFQGRASAPPLVKACLDSWETRNPGWEMRCLDASSIERLIPLRNFIDLERQTITGASLADIVRILLLHEFGGVWADATLFCHRPLDEWLPPLMEGGLFAFSSPGSGKRPLASWFLAAEAGNDLVSKWCRRTIDYWSNRQSTSEYFWFHHLFREMLGDDQAACSSWKRVPVVSADGPCALQFEDRMYRPTAEVVDAVDWSTPVFKLTHRLRLSSIYEGSLLEHLLESGGRRSAKGTGDTRDTDHMSPPPAAFASLKTSTNNLGDHIQIIASLELLSRLGIEPDHYIDRDTEIRSAPMLAGDGRPVGIVLNGWFKRNGAEWPPHPLLRPLIIGFHARPRKCPALLSGESLVFLCRYEPVGCRDSFTRDLLSRQGLDAFESNCLSLTLPKRIDRPEEQTVTFLVSKDAAICAALPWPAGSYRFVSHYTDANDFDRNMEAARVILADYRSQARLIVTTLLHCALPAIAMGIPVIIFYPPNDDAGHRSDVERFSTLAKMTRIYHLDEMDEVDWNPAPVDVSEAKLRLLDQFHEKAQAWHLPPRPIGPIAPSVRFAPA